MELYNPRGVVSCLDELNAYFLTGHVDSQIIQFALIVVEKRLKFPVLLLGYPNNIYFFGESDVRYCPTGGKQYQS